MSPGDEQKAEDGELSYAERGIRRLRAEGFKLTSQRRAVLELLDDSREHWTAKQIYRALEPTLASLSLTTVYNTLELLKSQGLVDEVVTDEGETFFDPNATPHHHAVCRECGGIFDIDVDGEALRDLAEGADLSDGEERGFEIRDVSVLFRGLCEGCGESVR